MDMQITDLDAALAELGPEFAARVADHDADDSFVAENYAALKERRVFSAMVPTDLGGGGRSYTAMARFLRGLAPFCSSTALALAMHQHLSPPRSGIIARAILAQSCWKRSRSTKRF